MRTERSKKEVVKIESVEPETLEILCQRRESCNNCPYSFVLTDEEQKVFREASFSVFQANHDRKCMCIMDYVYLKHMHDILAKKLIAKPKEDEADISNCKLVGNKSTISPIG